jgi:multiple sugar transport system substrate-binding protein
LSSIKDAWRRFRALQPYQRNRILFGGGVAVLAGALILVFVGILPGGKRGPDLVHQADIEIWDVFDDEQVYSKLISAYRDTHSGAKITYVKKEVETYRQEVLTALASGNGPDIYAIHNTWLLQEKSRLQPMNTALPEVDPNLLLADFPDVVRFDFAREEDGENMIYALPFSIDTLALYYNRTLFNSANIFEPPATWDEFAEDVRILRRIAQNGDVQVAGAAIGGGDNVNRSQDILSLLMMQNGTEMNNEKRTRVTFSSGARNTSGVTVHPGREALSFYTSFADPTSENYTWDATGPYSIDAFAQGTAAMMINYSFHRKTIEEKSPHLDFAIAPVPQPAERVDQVNYANYWGLAVAKQSQVQEDAWDFIHFATNAENATIYLDRTQRPAAAKALVQQQLSDPLLGAFARQVLSAKSWVQGDSDIADQALEAAITSIVKGGVKNFDSVLDVAASKINVTLKELTLL